MRLASSSLLLLTCLSSACEKGEPLTAQSIAEGEARWQKAGSRSYDLRLEISGDRIAEGEFVVQVRDGAITSVTRNGLAVTSRDPFYTVDGMYGFLRDELELAAEPGRYWQAGAESQVVQRAHFDAERGYTRRYLRAVTGTDHNILVKVTAFEPVS